MAKRGQAHAYARTYSFLFDRECVLAFVCVFVCVHQMKVKVLMTP